MITCRQITDRRHSCDNCDREMPLNLKYQFMDGNGRQYNELTLCEDCSAAMSNLHYKVMVEGKAHQYDMDEITEVKTNDFDS